MQRITAGQVEVWLQSHNHQGGEYPFYTDEQLRRRNDRHGTVSISEEAAGLPPVVTAYLAESRVLDHLDALRLSPVDRAVAAMRAAGFTLREISDRTGLKLCRVERALKTTARRLRAAARAEGRGSEGWQEVYLAETRRGTGYRD
ncbi:MAG TPA: hypothetical protein VGM51_15490 [Armatimonadota bacterium]|jgi:lambda repressor-like predicted transcriptional regulator